MRYVSSDAVRKGCRMTREEAIRRMEICRDFLANNYSDMGEPNFTAFEMAIQALSQEPTEKPMCDRNICISNEYNGIGCDECIVNKAEQEPCADAEQIDYHDDFATALKKINDYEMTRDERAAISILNAYKVGYESGMEDLEQEPCDDAISREDAIKAECEVCDICGNMRYTKCQYFMQGCNEVKCLRELPPVTQKSGKWIDYSDEGYVECPFCEHATTCEDNIDELHYCFYCGARMFEPQESEDKE